jgi:hypothetical protein
VKELNKKFEKEVLKLRPAWRGVAGYFCMMPVDLILCGFAWDRSSGGAYIWRYAFPLFDRARPVSLLFGQRLPYPEDFLSIVKGHEHAAASEFIARAARYEAEVSSLSEPAAFLTYVDSLGAFRNPWVRRGYALTLIVLGRTLDAAAQLEMLLRDASINNIPDFREDMTTIARELVVNPDSTRASLLKRAVDNRRALGLEEVSRKSAS